MRVKGMSVPRDQRRYQYNIEEVYILSTSKVGRLLDFVGAPGPGPIGSRAVAATILLIFSEIFRRKIPNTLLMHLRLGLEVHSRLCKPLGSTRVLLTRS